MRLASLGTAIERVVRAITRSKVEDPSLALNPRRMNHVPAANNATTVTTVDARTYRQSTASIVRDQMHALRDLRLG